MDNSKDVINLYSQLKNIDIEIWIDGGWCVDALLEEKLRPHQDLDIAIQEKDVIKLCKFLNEQGYKKIAEDNKWNFVLANEEEQKIDVHSFVYDKEKKEIIDGIMYPIESLTGIGKIDGKTVNCISAKYMVKFLTPWLYKWPQKYAPAISKLCDKFQIELPKEYLEYIKQYSRSI